MIVLTVIAGGTILAGGNTNGIQETLWRERQATFRAIASSFRVQEAAAPKP
jgi:hypothetical protein